MKGNKMKKKNWDRAFFRYSVRFAFLFIGLLLVSVIFEFLPNVKIFTEWGLFIKILFAIFFWLLPNCVFRPKSSTDSALNRPPIPIQTVH